MQPQNPQGQAVAKGKLHDYLNRAGGVGQPQDPQGQVVWVWQLHGQTNEVEGEDQQAVTKQAQRETYVKYVESTVVLHRALAFLSLQYSRLISLLVSSFCIT